MGKQGGSPAGMKSDVLVDVVGEDREEIRNEGECNDRRGFMRKLC